MTTTPRRSTVLLASALAVPALLALGSTASFAAGPAPMRDLCIPVPGVPCLPVPGGPTATTPTSITGSPKVDRVVTATEPVWSDPSAVTTYQWQRDGADIADATQQTYTVQLDDLGASLTVVATGTISVISSGTSTSDPVVGLTGDAPTTTREPSITGDPRVGGELTTVPGTWSGSPTPTFGYQWYRVTGGSAGAISGATERTYVPKVGDAGNGLAVVVTADRPGHEPGRAAATTTIAKRTSTTELTSTTRQVTAGRRAVVRVRIDSQGGTPTGSVEIFDAAKKIATVKVGTRAHGRVTVTLPRLAVGRHPLTARFVATSAIASSTSKKLVLTVTR